LCNFLLNLYIKNYNQFLEELDFIGGRYVVIVGNKNKLEIFPDATAARSSYYSEKETLVSSHVELINDNRELEELPLATIDNKLKFFWNLSPYKNIKSISPNFKIDVINKTRTRFFPRDYNKYKSMSHQNRLIYIEKLWKEQIKYYCENYSNIIFSISGGADSRVCLAMAREYQNNMKFFTYSVTEGIKEDTKYSSVLSKDQYIVKQILNDIPLNHKFFYFDKKEFGLSKQQSEIIKKNAVKSHGKFIFSFYLKNFPEFKVMHMRGTPLEIGRAYFLAKNRKSSIEEIKSTFMFNFKNSELSESDKNNVFSDAIEQFEYHNDVFGYHLLDLYYWENRMGRWHSEILNENDVCFETVMPFNMRAMINISMSYSRIQRRDGYMFNELINRNYPILNFYGKNEVENLYEKSRDLNLKDEMIIDKFEIYESDKLVDKIDATENLFYLPKDFFENKYKSQVDFTFTKEEGFLDINLENSYRNKSAKDYFKCIFEVNGKEVAKVDLTQWIEKSTFRIFNLKKYDKISLSLKPFKNLKRDSWEKASMTKITKVKEIESNIESPVNIVSDNPVIELS